MLRFEFYTRKLEELYTHEKGSHKYPPEVIEAFFNKMAVIDSALDERDLYNMKSLHYEHLHGDQKDYRSIRINKKWRLKIKVDKDESGNYLLIIDLENHYGD